ncbi:hypothetical protein XELAEV_18020525mg [Xenopus laevis]|uniref:Uncharacterized protein n=1 Tax=Xenopus laevis TaxID=8355 RepID=A0A974D9T9_XENLA|nr:hypothetical protein XELAEV_18020525mg [Xenopus laevis]
MYVSNISYRLLHVKRNIYILYLFIQQKAWERTRSHRYTIDVKVLNKRLFFRDLICKSVFLFSTKFENCVLFLKKKCLFY